MNPVDELVSDLKDLSTQPTVYSTQKDPPRKPPSLKKKPPQRKRGQFSRTKRAEQGRAKINEKIHSSIQTKAQSEAIDTNIMLFGSRRLTPVFKPSLSFSVYTDKLIELCVYISEVLHRSCKIQPPNSPSPIEFDADTLIFVTAHQISTKLHFARIGSRFLHFADLRAGLTGPSFGVYQRVSSHLTRTLTPLAAALDHIGKFTLNGQEYIPMPVLDRSGSHHHLKISLLEQNRACQWVTAFRTAADPRLISLPGRFGATGRPLYARIMNEAASVAGNIFDPVNRALNPTFLQDPDAFPWFGAVEFVELPDELETPTYGLLVQRYSDLIGRIERKLSSSVFREVNLVAGLGTPAQIVMVEPNESEVNNVWCARDIGEVNLEFGAVMEYGCLTQPLGLREVASVEAHIDVSGALVSMANVLTKRLVQK